MSDHGLVYIPCPLCDDERSSIFCKDSGMTFQRCAGCGLVFLNPRPPTQAFAAASRRRGKRQSAGTANPRPWRHGPSPASRGSSRLLREAGFEVSSMRPSRSEYGLSDLQLALKTGYHAASLALYFATCGRLFLSIDLLILARPSLTMDHGPLVT